MRFNRFIYLFLLLLWLLATKSTKYIGEEKNTGNFNRGESLDSPHTGYGPVIGNFEELAGEGLTGGGSQRTHKPKLEFPGELVRSEGLNLPRQEYRYFLEQSIETFLRYRK